LTIAESGLTKQARSRGRRLYRGLAFGVMAGVVGAGMAIIPALFVQAIFIGNIQRCEAQQEFDLAAKGAIETTCAHDLSDPPEWIPPALIAGGGLVGLLGGFGFGYVSPTPPPERFEKGENFWLPF
jgi:hypothetical protein